MTQPIKDIARAEKNFEKKFQSPKFTQFYMKDWIGKEISVVSGRIFARGKFEVMTVDGIFLSNATVTHDQINETFKSSEFFINAATITSAGLVK